MVYGYLLDSQNFMRSVRSLYNWSQSLVRIAGIKSDLFSVRVGLAAICHPFCS